MDSMSTDTDDLDFPPKDDQRLLVAEFEALIDSAVIVDLELMPPVGNNEHSADLMVRSPSRPPIGVQGMILDAMCEDRLTTPQTIDLLKRVHVRIKAARRPADGR
jgi:hypothetical protein